MGRDATGSVKLKRGRWIARFRGAYLGSHATEQAGWDAVKVERQQQEGKEPDVLNVYGDAWFIDRELAGDTRDIQGERSVWRTHILTAKFADWPMRRVQPIDIDEWLTVLSKKEAQRIHRRKVAGEWVTDLVPAGRPISKDTLKHARRVCSAIFADALRRGKVRMNPVRDSKIPKMARPREEEEEWTFLEPSEIRTLFAKIEKAKRADFYRAFYAVAIYAGLRQGEICGLRWRDIKPDCIQVRYSFGLAVKATSSHRTVPMLPPLKAALDAWRRHGGTTKAHGLVFPADGAGRHTKTGHHSRGYDANWEKQWRAKVGCAPHITFHDLRHTCASHLLMGTWGMRLELVELRDWLGHADIQTTQRYAHLAPGSLAARVKEMEER
jgi:integrase